MDEIEEKRCVVWVCITKGAHSDDRVELASTLYKYSVFPLVARHLETIDVYMAHVCFMSVVVTVWRSVGMFIV